MDIPDIVTRYEGNPILTPADIPGANSVFNSAVAKYRGKYMAILRVEMKDGLTHMFLAESADGVKFRVLREVLVPEEEPWLTYEGAWYDPRITQIGDTYYVAYCIENDWGVQCSLARTKDFQSFEKVSLLTEPNNRNVVLFPEKMGGRFVRLDRPNRSALEGGVSSGDEIWFSSSDDLVRWKPEHAVMAGRWHYWDERIGSGPPPVKTRQGWLHLYHGIATHFAAASIYQVGAVLLDLKEPWRVLARSWNNILEPRETYEMVGQVPNVVFPGGMIVERMDADGFAAPDSPVHVYYGAADTCVGLATTTIKDLLDACDGPA